MPCMPRIVCDDALSCVSDLGIFDYVITDPPYPTGGESSLRTASGIQHAREMIDAMAQSFIAGVLRQIRKADPFSVWLFCDWRQVSYFSSILRSMGMPHQSCIVWNKMRPGMSNKYHPCYELILWASTSGPTVGFMGFDIVEVKGVSSSNKMHPFDKPPAVVQAIAGAFPIGRCLDPFCGAGGLLLGAYALGWDVVGVDVSKQFCTLAEQRLAVASHELWDVPLPEVPAVDGYSQQLFLT